MTDPSDSNAARKIHGQRTGTVQKRSGANTVEVSDGAYAAIEELKEILPDDYMINVAQDNSFFIKDAVREAGDLDHETVTAIRDLAKDFRTSLQDTFLAAGRGHDFDHSVILSGVGDAIVAMTDGLRALRGAEDPTPPKELPVVVPPPEVPDEDTVPEEPIPGGLLSVYV